MGQQQLLLVILVTIIVGIATVVAINTFSSAAEGANLDAVRQDVANIAASAQGFYIKPKMLGGGGNSFEGMTFNNITFAADALVAGGLEATNSNGTYTIAVVAGNVSFTVTAEPSSQTDGSYMEATITSTGITWTNSAALIGAAAEE